MRITALNVLLGVSGALAKADSLTCPSNPLQVNNQVCASPEFIRLASRKGLNDATTPQPFWKGPEHCVNDTCIYSNERVGNGIVILTSVRNAEIASKFAAVPRVNEDNLPFHVAEVPGKGIGIIADRNIPKGEIILTRTPTMMVQTAPHVGFEPGTRDVLYDLAIQKLPSKGQELFMGQMGKDVYDKIETNCFQLYIDGANETGSHLGCYPEISRFNHDCRPNLLYRISNMTHTTVAARDIKAGEELSISYIELFLPRSERRSRLSKWGFECSCSACKASDAESVASDARLVRIAELQQALENFNETIVTAETGAIVAGLYEEERLYIYIGRAYTRAALNLALFGESERAQEYARLAAEALEREAGEDSPDAKAMRLLAEDPKKHWTWGKRRKAKPSKEQ